MNKYINLGKTTSFEVSATEKNIIVCEHKIHFLAAEVERQKERESSENANNKIILGDYIRTKVKRAYRHEIEKIEHSHSTCRI